jgi:DNA helicase-2/ATP-dependent DNA helicase PcrA
MVIAGPGTGKTQILTLRIANILRLTDAGADAVLALTFTEAAAMSMRRRLAQMIGSAAYSVKITTFHSFCNEVIERYPEHFPHIIGASNITEVDQVQLVEGILAQSSVSMLKPFGDPLYYLRPIVQAIGSLKREGVAPERFFELCAKERKEFEEDEDKFHTKGPHKGKMKGEYKEREKMLRKNEELASLYEAYQRRLRETHVYDFSDMIMEVVGVLENDQDILLSLQERYLYMLVDEHQDTNNAQNRLLELLGNYDSKPNLFVVGDEKQAIFRFQGASLENFLHFKKLYPDAQLIVLDKNYRSTQEILDTVHPLGTRIASHTQRLLAHKGPQGKKIGVYAFSRPDVENYFLASSIGQLIAEGVPAHEVAVLYRDNRDAVPIAHALEQAGVPFTIESDQNILHDNDVRKLIALLFAVHEFGNDARLIEAMHVDFLEIPALDIYKATRAAYDRHASMFDVLRDEEGVKELKLQEYPRLRAFAAKIEGWVRDSKNMSLSEFFEKLVRESGYVGYILSRSASLERLGKLQALFDEIRSLQEKHKDYGLGDLIGYIQTFRQHELMLKRGAVTPAVNRVRLMTAHRSKGQEFDYVYITGVYDGHWGNRRRSDPLALLPAVYSLSGASQPQGDANDDERRLFYVAITRAKKDAMISYAMMGSSQREQLPSQFIQEIDQALVEYRDAQPYEAEIAAHPEKIYAAPVEPGEHELRDKEYVRELFMRQGFSVTSLNNYLDCPWKYFYLNLIRIPTATTKQQLYGIAVHAALKDFFDRYREADPGEQFLLERFEHAARLQPFTQRDFDESLEKGRKALSGYYQAYRGQWQPRTRTEYLISGIQLTPEICLSGKLDKIEFIEGENEVNVVDYKTGRPKTRGEIEGTTKSSAGDIKRQLLFYALLLRNHEKGRFAMRTGEIDFMEPDASGSYRREFFEIEKSDIDALEEVVRTAAQEIMDLAFWDRTCGDKDCPWCGLRALMR